MYSYLPTGSGIENTLRLSNGKYHNSCRPMLHNSKLECVQKRLVSIQSRAKYCKLGNFRKVLFLPTSPIRTKDKDSKIVFHGKGKKFALQFWIFLKKQQ